MKKALIDILNQICLDKGYEKVDLNNVRLEDIRLREDVGFDSLDLAQLTVQIEEEFDVDVFDDGIVSTIGELFQKVNKGG